MCTVSFFPGANGDFIFTSNRDESPNRETILPDYYTLSEAELLFPKDKVAGGTWIGLSEKKRLICLLNGGFTSHIPKEKYRQSRGVVVTDLLSSGNAISLINEYNFDDIEPFTLILVEFKKQLQLYELVWDSIQKHFIEKPLMPTIWSSSLLYSETIKMKREKWFSQFLDSAKSKTQESFIRFHKTAGEGDKNSDLVMDRGFVRTKSITSILKQNTILEMRYEDLITNEVSLNTL